MIKTLKRLFKPQTKSSPVEMVMWHEIGQHLPAAPIRSPLAVPVTQPIPVEWPDVRKTGVSIEEVTRIVIVDLLQCPLQFMKIVEQNGRVVLALYQPHNHYDPLLPFPLINMGEDFKREFRAMALELSSWVSEMFALVTAVEKYNTATGYLHRMPPRPRPVSAALYYGNMSYHMERAIKIAYASSKMTPQELRYFDYQLRLCIAQPDRFTQYDNEEWRRRWQTAVGYNNTLSGER